MCGVRCCVCSLFVGRRKLVVLCLLSFGDRRSLFDMYSRLFVLQCLSALVRFGFFLV